MKPGIALKVFTACSAMKRHSQQVTFFILPHIILQVLQNGSAEDTTEVSLKPSFLALYLTPLFLFIILSVTFTQILKDFNSSTITVLF